LRARGIEAVCGNAADPELLKAANLAGARWFVSAIPNPFENGNLLERARALNSGLEIIARAHSDEEVDYLQKHGADLIIMGEREIARGMAEHIQKQLDGGEPARDGPSGADAFELARSTSLDQAPSVERKEPPEQPLSPMNAQS
jgi:voltage-gated potassium channel Kch